MWVCECAVCGDVLKQQRLSTAQWYNCQKTPKLEDISSVVHIILLLYVFCSKNNENFNPKRHFYIFIDEIYALEICQCWWRRRSFALHTLQTVCTPHTIKSKQQQCPLTISISSFRFRCWFSYNLRHLTWCID